MGPILTLVMSEATREPAHMVCRCCRLGGGVGEMESAGDGREWPDGGIGGWWVESDAHEQGGIVSPSCSVVVLLEFTDVAREIR